MKKTEQELREYAAEQAKNITIRTYNNGSSNDETRKATKRESKIIESIIFGGLLAIRHGSNKDGAKTACEFIAMQQLPGINSYDTIYIPIAQYKFDQ